MRRTTQDPLSRTWSCLSDLIRRGDLGPDDVRRLTSSTAELLATVGRISPARILSRVLLPAPFGPNRARISPLATRRFTPRRAGCAPNHLTRSLVSTAGATSESPTTPSVLTVRDPEHGKPQRHQQPRHTRRGAATALPTSALPSSAYREEYDGKTFRRHIKHR